jgi:hypothetical protein
MSWKLISIYHFRKYDLNLVQFNTGYPYLAYTQYLVRKEEYEKKRDSTFDFMQLGETDYEKYRDSLV